MAIDWKKIHEEEKAQAQKAGADPQTPVSPPSASSSSAGGSAEGMYTNIPDLRSDLVEYVRLRDAAAKEILALAWPKILTEIEGKYIETSQELSPDKRIPLDVSMRDDLLTIGRYDDEAHEALRRFLEAGAKITRGPNSRDNIELEAYSWKDNSDNGTLALNFELAHAINKLMRQGKSNARAEDSSIQEGVTFKEIKERDGEYDIMRLSFPRLLIKAQYDHDMGRSSEKT